MDKTQNPQPKSKKQDFTSGKIRNVPISNEMEKAYLDYAMSVIVARALPDVRDGLKPVQRRILYAMKGLNLSHTSAYKKSARIVGETIGKYHPHGDTAIYDAMVRLAQDFSLRYPLVWGQGNFGSIDGDPPAHMRYTEARLQKITNLLLGELDKNTVDFVPNFDGSENEPAVLPSKFPNLLTNGVDGIAVGMATKIPPHNLGELVDSLIFLLKKGKVVNFENAEDLKETDPDLFVRLNNFYTQYDQNTPFFIKPQIQYFYLDATKITVEDLMQFVPGPDFPTGGEIYDRQEILQAYSTGKGRILMRAKSKIVETGKPARRSAVEGEGKMQIEVLELPYQQNKALLIERIANLVKDGKLDDISDLRDESDRTGLKIVIELKRGANPQRVLNRLCKFTPMQQTYHVNMVALENNVPKVMTLKGILLAFLKHQQELVIRRTAHELIQALHRDHILQGLKIALDNLDAVIKTIRKSANADVARINLMEKFELTEIQANAILEMQLRRLAALEREKILNELKDITAIIKNYKEILASPKQIVKIIRTELTALKETYGDKRRTKIYKGKSGEIGEEELIKAEETIIVLSQGGYIKRLSPQSFKTQARGGKGVTGGKLKEEDVIYLIRHTNTHDQVLFFTSKGRVFNKRVWDVPEASRTARGIPAVNLIGIDQDEKITSVLTLT